MCPVVSFKVPIARSGNHSLRKRTVGPISWLATAAVQDLSKSAASALMFYSKLAILTAGGLEAESQALALCSNLRINKHPRSITFARCLYF
jgi:hypothetical protein